VATLPGDARLTAGVGMPRAGGSVCLEELLRGFRGILHCNCYSAYGTPAAAHLAITQDRFVPGELKASGGFL
jgi:hypothetical protein